jgi:hypothetical protein
LTLLLFSHLLGFHAKSLIPVYGPEDEYDSGNPVLKIPRPILVSMQIMGLRKVSLEIAADWLAIIRKK